MARSDRVGGEDSEFGGASGLIQPPLAPDGTPGHELTAGEQAQVLRRAGRGETRVEEEYTPKVGVKITKFPYTEEQALSELREQY